MSNGYTVIGEAGQYEDYEAWVVAVFTSEQRANAWARKAAEHAGSDAGNPYDPEANTRGGRPKYTVIETPLNPQDPFTGIL